MYFENIILGNISLWIHFNQVDHWENIQFLKIDLAKLRITQIILKRFGTRKYSSEDILQ